MRKVLLLLLLALVAVPLAGAERASKPVHVYVVVPNAYSSTITPQQAVEAVHDWLGDPSDAPCTGSPDCSIEGWFRAELGLVFDYTVSTMSVTYGDSQADACGSFSWSGLLTWLNANVLTKQQERDRFIYLMLGAGGWAGHYFSKGGKGSALVGDWGVMRHFNAPNACIPDWVNANGGFSHEFAGMMGMYMTDGYSGALFVGDSMTENNKRDLLKYSGAWLR